MLFKPPKQDKRKTSPLIIYYYASPSTINSYREKDLDNIFNEKNEKYDAINNCNSCNNCKLDEKGGVVSSRTSQIESNNQ